MRLAGVVLLTAGGQPYIYQGEELGYWGSKSSGDEDVRHTDHVELRMVRRSPTAS